MEEIELSILCITLLLLRHGVIVSEHKNEYGIPMFGDKLYIIFIVMNAL